MGVVLNKLGNVESAREYYEKSIKNNHFYPYSYLNYAVTYKEEGDFKRAAEILSEGIDYNDEEGFLYYNRACCLCNLKKYDEALDDVLKSVECNNFFEGYSKEDIELKNIWNRI